MAKRAREASRAAASTGDTDSTERARSLTSVAVWRYRSILRPRQ